MNVKIRAAIDADVQSIADIADKCSIEAAQKSGTSEGFVVPNPVEQYQYFVRNDEVFVVDDADYGDVVGFSIALGPESIQRSGLWEQSSGIEWIPGFPGLPDLEISAYYDQIAFLPDYRKTFFTAYLGFFSLTNVLKKYRHIFTAVAEEPYANTAPLPFLHKTGWEAVGTIRETMPGAGKIRYTVYYNEQSRYLRLLDTPLGVSFTKKIEPYIGHIE